MWWLLAFFNWLHSVPVMHMAVSCTFYIQLIRGPLAFSVRVLYTAKLHTVRARLLILQWISRRQTRHTYNDRLLTTYLLPEWLVFTDTIPAVEQASNNIHGYLYSRRRYTLRMSYRRHGSRDARSWKTIPTIILHDTS